MLEPIEKFFPNFLTKVREFPVMARVLLVVLIFAGPAGLTWAYSLSNTRELRIPLNTLVLGGVGAILTAIALSLIGHQIRVRLKLRQFLADWQEFKGQFKVLCVRIEGYLMRDRKRESLNDNESLNDSLKALDALLPSVKKYWSLRDRLREDVFRIGESRLCVNRNVRWESLKRESALVSEYATPFSFLLDRGQPIAEWNKNHNEIWAALHIADDFVEYLGFRHPTLKRHKIGASSAA